MTNFVPIVDGETPAHEAINSRLQSLGAAVGGKSAVSGTIAIWPTGSIPTDWLACDGSGVSRTTYAALFALLGTTFGSGDGSTTFNLPDLRGRAVGGVGTGSSLSTRSLGAQAGEENHQLTIPELPAHTHTNSVGSIGATNATAAVGSSEIEGTTTSGNAGSDTPHNNMQPSLVLNWIIKT